MAIAKYAPPPSARMRGIRTDDDALIQMERGISERLRKLRDASGVRNGTLAQALGMHYISVCKIMAGEGVRQFAKLGIIARMLNTTPNHILGFAEPADSGRLRAALEAGIMALGVPEDGAVVTAEAILATLAEPMVSRAGSTAAIPAEDILRIQVDAAVRHSARQHSQPSARA